MTWERQRAASEGDRDAEVARGGERRELWMEVRVRWHQRLQYKAEGGREQLTACRNWIDDGRWRRL